MKKRLIIYGAGGLGREILSLVKSLTEWEVVGFIDDSEQKNTISNEFEILGGWKHLNLLKEKTGVVLAVGSPVAKAQLYSRISNPNIFFPTLIHPSAIIQDTASVVIGNGSIICAGSILTTGITIGNHVLININSTIGHDSSVGNFSSIMPGVNVAGEVDIEDLVLIGSGSNIINRVRIMRESIVGMGSVVIHNVAANSTVVGVPAKPIKP